MINWLIKFLGGYTVSEMNSEKIKNLMAQADLIDQHQKELKDLEHTLLSAHPILYRKQNTE